MEPRHLIRREEKTIAKRGKRGIVRRRAFEGQWIVHEQFYLAEPRPGGGQTMTVYRSQEEAERALDMASGGGDLLTGDDEPWRLTRSGMRDPDPEPWRLT